MQSHIAIPIHGLLMFTASMKLGAVMMLGKSFRRQTLAGPGAC